jgi:hypothetical protein
MDVDEEDRQRLDVGLRELCSRHQLDWVVTQIDAIVAEGDMRTSASRQEYSIHDRFGFPRRGAIQRPKEAVLQSVPFTPLDRTLMLIDALTSVFEQLPEIRRETLNRLTDGYQGRVAPIRSIAFGSELDTVDVIVDGSEITEYPEVLAALRAARDEATATDEGRPS